MRFPGFEGAWSAEYFDDVATGFEYGLNAAAVDFDGVHKYIRITDIDDTSHKFIGSPVVSPAGEIDEKYRVRPNDILLARTGASTGKSYLYDSSDGELYFAGFLIRASVKPEYDARFVFYSTCTPPYRRWVNMISMRSGQPGINADEYSRYNLNIPTHSEQVQIGTSLAILDSKITAQHKLVEILKKHKRGLSNALFSGKVRMARNTKWKTYRLGDIVRRVTRKNGKVSDVPLTISAQYGLIDQREFFSKAVASADMSGYYLLKQGEFAYNRSSSGEYPFGSIKRLERYNQGAVSTLYICFEVLGDKDDAEFLKWYFGSFAWHREVGMICAEGARNHGLLNVPTDGFFDTKHKLPTDKNERKKIATLMALADARCEHAETELNRLTTLKSGLLQQLFV